MTTQTTHYTLVGAYGGGPLSTHATLAEAMEAIGALSWHERSGAYPHGAHIVDADGERVTDFEAARPTED